MRQNLDRGGKGYTRILFANELVYALSVAHISHALIRIIKFSCFEDILGEACVQHNILCTIFFVEYLQDMTMLKAT